MEEETTNFSLSQLESLYNESVARLSATRASVADLEAKIAGVNEKYIELRMEWENAVAQGNAQLASNLAKVWSNYEVARNSFQSQLNIEKAKLPIQQKEIDTAYKNWIDAKKVGMTPAELAEYASVGVESEAQMQAAKNKTYMIIAVVVVVLIITGFVIYRKYGK